MPIHRAKLPNGQMGYKWGEHGHVYPTREGAEGQSRAAYSHGYTGDDLMTAAGIALKTPDGKYLFVKDAGRKTWCFPGGKAEAGEDDLGAAIRELEEETGIAHDGPFTILNRAICDGVDYTTYTAPIQKEVKPDLDGENTDYVWAGKDNLPEPMHPAIKEFMTEMPAQDMALDKAPTDLGTVRSKDRDGRLHVELTNISKSNICPYQGKEIPTWRELGLDPEKIYHLYRHPDELEKAAPTFNNVPLLSEHVPVDVKDYRPDLVIGATGSDAIFEYPYLKNSLVVWANDAVNGIESERQKEISCAYYYTPDMTPGEADGQPYDGVMRDIIANHVAVVVEGRAGPDVVVGDSALENTIMPRAKKGRQERTREAIVAYVLPKMAADATLDDINLLLEKLEDTEPKMEDDNEPAAVQPTVDDDAEVSPAEKVKALIKESVSPEVFAKIEALLGGEVATDDDDDLPMAGGPMGADDDDDDDGEKPYDKAAMDAAMKAAEVATIKRMNAVRDAERAVKPYVGELVMSFDSAAGVYRHALTALGVEITGVHSSALPAILTMVPKPSARVELIAQDGAKVPSFEERHPNAARVRF